MLSAETVDRYLGALARHDAAPANDAAKLIATRSPIALSATLAAVRRAAKLETLEDVLTQDYRVSLASCVPTTWPKASVPN